jgi:hypothetical protein
MSDEATKQSRLDRMSEGPNAAKADLLKKMLADDTERIMRFIQEPDDFKDVPIGDDSAPT